MQNKITTKHFLFRSVYVFDLCYKTKLANKKTYLIPKTHHIKYIRNEDTMQIYSKKYIFLVIFTKWCKSRDGRR